MSTNVLQIGTLSLAGMVTTALFVVPLVGDNVAEKAVKRDDDAGAVVLASDGDDDDADDRFGARTNGPTTGPGTDTGTGGATTGPGTDTGTGGATTGPGTDTGTGGDNSGPGNAEDGHHADRSGPSGPDNSGPGNAHDTMTMDDDNSGSGSSGGDDSGGDDSGGDDSGGDDSWRRELRPRLTLTIEFAGLICPSVQCLRPSPEQADRIEWVSPARTHTSSMSRTDRRPIGGRP